MDWINHLVEQHGYLGVTIAMFIENLVQVIPSELIMPLAGYLVAQEKMELIPTVIAGTTGTVAGTLPWYLIGRSINEEKIGTYLDKHGQWLGLGSKNYKNQKSGSISTER